MQHIMMFILTLFLIQFAAITSTETNCNKLASLIYKNLNCKPIFEKPSNCPLKYNCTTALKLKSDNCLFENKSYAIGESIDKKLLSKYCMVNCICAKPLEKAYFECVSLDCGEWLGVPVTENCYRSYRKNKCCSSEEICPSSKINVTKCAIDGKVYMNGQKFYPKNTCLECICNAQKFDLKNYQTKMCSRQKCGLQLKFPLKLEDNCAPVYLNADDGLCCPSKWICHMTSDEIKIVNAKNAGLASNLTCNFGKMELDLGEGLERKIQLFGNEKNIICECILPPLLTCKVK